MRGMDWCGTRRRSGVRLVGGSPGFQTASRTDPASRHGNASAVGLDTPSRSGIVWLPQRLHWPWEGNGRAWKLADKS
jgi:hypothetical protein